MENEGATLQRYDRDSHRRLQSGFSHNNGDESQAVGQTSGGQESSRSWEIFLRRLTLNSKLKKLEEEIERLNLQSGEEATSLKELDSEGGTAAEYLLVRDRTHRFFQPIHGIFPTVTKIEKIWSMKLQIKFLETESHLISHRSHTQLLFHRTSDDRIKRILKRGFRLPPANKTNMFGQGIYFATESSSSAQQKIYTRESNKLLLCEVLLGKTWTVQKPQPAMKKWIIKMKGYDSLLSKRAGNEGGGTLYDEFVVYDCYQAIPRYIVHYNNPIFDPAAMQPSQTLADQNLTRIQYKMSPTFCGDSPAEYHFRLAESQFFRMTSSNLYKVVMVELIINKTLLRRYERAKEEFGGKKPSVEERLVFHGTRKDAIEKIIEEGFKIGGDGVEVQNGRSFGSGVYTALDPTISVHYSGPERMMLLSFALLGEAGKDYSNGDSPDVLVFKKAEYLLPKYIVQFAQK